jgi:hypothetical protein
MFAWRFQAAAAALSTKQVSRLLILGFFGGGGACITAAALSSRQILDDCVARGATEGVQGAFKSPLELPPVDSLDA